jgi:glycosyltransferase involved in cell wall biosynthesis
VGRLSPEKGISTMLTAWEKLGPRIPLKIVGDGPLAEEVGKQALKNRIQLLGHQPRSEVRDLMRRAAFLVFPSEWYEGFPLVIAEAFAAGLPVIASDLGSMSNLVSEGRTGLLFRPGNSEDLAAKVEWMLEHPDDMARMRNEARAEYLAKYTEERNYQMLMNIYNRALDGGVQA